MGSSGTVRTSQDEDEEENPGHGSAGPSTDVFLAGGCSDPDTISLRLMKSGDVESNPGPTSLVACAECSRKFSDRHKPIQCRKCMGWFHATSCTSTKRRTIEVTLNMNATWTYITCDPEECDCGKLQSGRCRGNGECRKRTSEPLEQMIGDDSGARESDRRRRVETEERTRRHWRS